MLITLLGSEFYVSFNPHDIFSDQENEAIFLAGEKMSSTDLLPHFLELQSHESCA